MKNHEIFSIGRNNFHQKMLYFSYPPRLVSEYFEISRQKLFNLHVFLNYMGN